jgi:hypothetical protein
MNARGYLRAALAVSSAAAKLQAFAHSTGCNPLDLSIDQGKSLDLGRVLDAMRQRGYVVGELVRPQAQSRRDASAWTVTIGVRGVQVTLALYLPNPA